MASNVCIAGAGIIGLSLALELDARGLDVTVLEAGEPLRQASSAAAGMLAANDPENPPALQLLSNFSLSLYPAFLARVEQLSHLPVTLQTSRTLQAIHTSTVPALTPEQLSTLCPQLNTGDYQFIAIEEQSLDPRQLAAALLAAVRNTRIEILPNIRYLTARPGPLDITIRTSNGPIHADALVDCTGAWARPPIAPRKGQLLYVAPPAGLNLTCVVRTPQVYIVPRTSGPNAGRLLIGATVEDAGFDTATTSDALAHLQSLAADLIPSLAHAPILDSWAGLRPATPDALPLLGQLGPRRFLAAGHFRNGILLAPGTAHVMAQLLANEPPALDLTPYAPQRFPHLVRPAPALPDLSSPDPSDIRPQEP